MTVQLTAKKPSEPNFIDGNTGEAVYVIHGTYGNKQIRVPKDVPVTIEDTRANYGSYSSGPNSFNPRDHFPNIEVRDNALVIPIVDMLDEILERADPAALAESLWSNEEVRERFIECLTSRYSSDAMTIKDRLKFLRGVKEAIHDEHQWNLSSSMASWEHETRRRFHSEYTRQTYVRYHQVVMETLSRVNPEAYLEVITAHGKEPFSGVPDDTRDFDIGGKHWNEAEGYWRKAVREAFAFPPEPEDKDPVV